LPKWSHHASQNRDRVRRCSRADRIAVADKPHQSITGKVVVIADGDTPTVLDDSKVQHKIRLHGIDAPKRGPAVRDEGA
jgi:endonuclease YncB( thermonuclease family)